MRRMHKWRNWKKRNIDVMKKCKWCKWSVFVTHIIDIATQWVSQLERCLHAERFQLAPAADNGSAEEPASDHPGVHQWGEGMDVH
jgi:hypothetical protein